MERVRLPKFIGIELVRGCNFKCRMCTVTANHKGPMRFISLDTLKLIISRLKEENIKPREVYLFNFGEPLAHPNFQEVLKLIYESRVFEESFVTMYTNGSLLKDEKTKAILDFPVINKLIFSFDGFGDAESYTKLRGSHYQEVINNISAFSEQAKKQRPELLLETCSIIPRPGEVPDLEVKALEEANKALNAIFQPMGVSVVTRHMHNYSGEEGLEISGIRSEDAQGGCIHLERDSLYILDDGKVMPCCNVFDKKYNIGSIYDHTLTEILNSNEMCSIRHKVRIGKRNDVPMCKKCSVSLVNDVSEEWAYEYWENQLEKNQISDVIEKNVTRRLLNRIVEKQNSIEVINDKVSIDHSNLDTKLEIYSGKDISANYMHVEIEEYLSLPCATNSVDIVFVHDAVEYVEDVYHLLKEIYRVSKNETVVYMVGPYFNTSANYTNRSYKTLCSEDTLKPYDCSKQNDLIDYEEWYTPELKEYKDSQANEFLGDIRIQLLDMEFIYYKEYRKFGEEQKRRIRKAFSNVCEKVIYTFAINKESEPFSDDKLIILKQKAKQTEPELINKIRLINSKEEYAPSVLGDIVDVVREQFNPQSLIVDQRFIELDSKLNVNIEQLKIEISQIIPCIKECQKLVERVNELQNNIVALTQNQQRMQELDVEIIQKMERDNNALNCLIAKSKEDKSIYEAKISSLDSKLNELIIDKIQQQKNLDNLIKQQEILAKGHEILTGRMKQKDIENEKLNSLVQTLIIENQFKSMQLNNMHTHFVTNRMNNCRNTNYIRSTVARDFFETLVLNCKKFHKRSKLQLSEYIPYEGYYEYEIKGYGDRINFFITGLVGSRFLVEIVQDNEIKKQEVGAVKDSGRYFITCPNIKGKLYVRFRAMEFNSVLRVLEIENTCLSINKKIYLGGYVD